MDRIVVSPKRVDGAVWMTARVDGVRIEVGAAQPCEWRMFRTPTPGRDYDKATALAEAYEREHAAELAPLFAEAEAWRKAHP